MFVQREGHPGTSHRIEPPDTVHHPGTAKDIRQVVESPTPGIIHLGGCHRTRPCHLPHKARERFNRLAQVAHLCRPVVHLQVNIGMEVGIPRRIEILTPDTLKVGRKSARMAGATHQQVTSILEVKRRQLRILYSLSYLPEPLVGRQTGAILASQVE